MGLTAFATNKTLDQMFMTQGHTFYVATGTFYQYGAFIYLALFNGDPQNGGTEVNGTGYKRICLGMPQQNLDVRKLTSAFCASGTYEANSIDNVNTIAFDYAESNWGQVTHFAIYGAEDADTPPAQQNMILSGQFTSAVTITQGQVAMFKKRNGATAGAFKITMT